MYIKQADAKVTDPPRGERVEAGPRPRHQPVFPGAHQVAHVDVIQGEHLGDRRLDQNLKDHVRIKNHELWQ